MSATSDLSAAELVWKVRLATQYGTDTLEAEQRLSATQPTRYDNYLQRWLRRWSVAYRTEGDLEPKYRSSEGRVFPLVSYLVPAEEGHQGLALDAASAARFSEIVDGKLHWRWFLHPAEAERLFPPSGTFREDTRRWVGSPSSSHRSLFVLDPDRPDEAPFVLKLSLTRKMMGFSRVIRPKHVARAVGVTAYVRDAYRRTGGVLPSGFRWHYLPESFAFQPAGLSEGGYVAREFPADLNLADNFLIPFYALLSERPEGRWIDRIRKASGETDPERFLREKLIGPLLELIHQFSLDFGLSPELHKQNVGLIVDKTTLTLRGFFLRDMDGIHVDLAYRRAIGLPDPFSVPDWAKKEEDVLGADAAQICQAFNFFFLGAMNLDQLAKATLPRRDAYRVLREANRIHLKELNKRFGVRLKSLGSISHFWERHHRAITPSADFERVDPKKRRSLRRYGYLRQFELWLGRISAL